MFKNNVLFCTLFIFCLHINKTKSCESFKNIRVTYSVKRSELLQDEYISGCITSNAFLFQPVKMEIDGFNGSKFRTLPKGAFENLEELEHLTINFVDLQTIESKAFNKLPKLSHVHITDNNLTTFSSTVFQRQVRQQIKVLNLSANHLSDMEGFANMNKLEKLDLHENNLEEIDTDWFLFCWYLQSINMNTNKIKQIGSNNFMHVHMLRELFLDDNQISSIALNSFKNLEYLKILSLRHNELQYLQADIFGKREVALDSLLLSGNLINYLDREFMQKVTVGTLLVDGNPLKCACLDKIISWIASTKGTLLSCDLPILPSCVVASDLNCTETLVEDLTREFLSYAKTNVKQSDYLCINLDV